MPDTQPDYFSKQASEYARYRPGYPDSMFEFLADIAPRRNTALDCATGNGQAAVSLASFFRHVIATDMSPSQLAAATPHPNVSYVAARSEALPVRDGSIDLLTVAQAMHWFRLEEFHAETHRVLSTGGICAVWSYGFLTINQDIDEVIRYYHDEILGPFWPAERWLVLDGYASLHFPFKRAETRTFDMEADWPLDAMLGFLRTWSATQRYIDERGTNPVEQVASRLVAAWGDSRKKRHVRWPLSLRYGYAQE